jgi:hypothetical protein
VQQGTLTDRIQAIAKPAGAAGVERRTLMDRIPRPAGAAGVERRTLTDRIPSPAGAAGVERRTLTDRIPRPAGAAGVERRTLTDRIPRPRYTPYPAQKVCFKYNSVSSCHLIDCKFLHTCSHCHAPVSPTKE